MKALKLLTWLLGKKKACDLTLSDYVNIHKGERCFVVGNGPSLNKIDISYLKDEITLGANRVFLGFEKWGFHFNYWACIDEVQIKQQHKNYNKNLPKGMIKFVPEEFKQFFEGENYIPINMQYRYEPFPKFSSNMDVFYEGWTVTYMLLQMAYVMGCNPIYLVGVDYNFHIGKEEKIGGKWTDKDSKSHFISNYCDAESGTVWNVPQFDKTDLAFSCAAKFLRGKGIQVYNATPNSKLGFFPMVDYETVFFGNKFQKKIKRNSQSINNTRRLLLCFVENETHTLRALNCLGTNKKITLFQNKNRPNDPGLDTIEFEENDLNIVFEKNKDILSRKYFNEVYLSLDDNESVRNEAAQFLDKLDIPHKKVIVSDRYPVDTLKDALNLNNFDWVKAKSQKASNDLNNVPLYAIIGTYNEEDIIYAIIKNAFSQGCKKVFIVDNASTDNTISEAISAGAKIYRTFETDRYDELLRIRIINDAIEEISYDSGDDSIWWLWLDADEFPQGPNGLTIKDYLSTLDPEYRIVGSNQVNHFPTTKPYYIQRYHPFDFMPYGEEFNTKSFVVNHCSVWHWKHPLHKYVKDKPMIRAKIGFHMGYCSEQLLEPDVGLETHHFPFRDKENTYKRFTGLCGENGDSRNKYNDETSVKGKSAITKRYENLDHIYSLKWDKVYINPAPMTENSKIGINPKRLNFSSPVWYKKEELEKVLLKQNIKVAIFSINHPKNFSGGRYLTFLLAASLSYCGANVHYVTDCKPVFFDDLKELPNFNKIKMHISKDYSNMPPELFDIVIMVPHLSRDTTLIKRARNFVNERKAKLVIINFETPNWFNLYSQEKRDVMLWNCLGELCKDGVLILSSAKESQMFAKEFYNDYPDRTMFAYWSPSINSFVADKTEKQKKEKSIVIITRLIDKHKGFKDIRELLCQELSGYTIKIINGYREINNKKITELKVIANIVNIKIEVLTVPSDREKFKEIKKAKVMVFPSYFEGYGYPPIEALYCNTPCVAYDLPVLRETCSDALIYAERGNVKDLRKKVIEAINSPLDNVEHLREKVYKIANFETNAKKIHYILMDYTNGIKFEFTNTTYKYKEVDNKKILRKDNYQPSEKEIKLAQIVEKIFSDRQYIQLKNIYIDYRIKKISFPKAVVKIFYNILFKNHS